MVNQGLGMVSKITFFMLGKFQVYDLFGVALGYALQGELRQDGVKQFEAQLQHLKLPSHEHGVFKFVGEARRRTGQIDQENDPDQENDSEYRWPSLGQLYGKLMEKIRLKALGSYSASIWSYNLSICFWENPKTFISIMSGLLNVSPSPKTNYCYLCGHQDTSKSSKESQVTFENISLQNIGHPTT